MHHQHRATYFLCSELVSLQFVDGSGRRHTLTANLEEIGPRRLSVLSERRIPPGSPTTIETKGQSLRGYARSAVRSEPLGWIVDVRLAPNSCWSQELFTPEHLLEPLRPAFHNPCRRPPAQAFTLTQASEY
ncbi:MAG: hypothetical protein IT163_07685 [Bryobacterales bacterium]|nr:hypothetical protein [Bryobacterales bacterium]